MCMVCEPARLESASCRTRVGSVWVERGRFGHSERAVRMGCGKRENGVRTAVGVWGNAFGVGRLRMGCGKCEIGVWIVSGRVEVAMCMVCEPHGWSLRVVTLVWGVCGSNEEGSVIVREQ